MSKKTFTAAPKPRQPTTDEIAAFENGGAGHDRRQAAISVAPAEVVTTEHADPIKRLSVDLPASSHTRFKTACSATGRKMVSELAIFIDRRTAELEAEAGITRK
jgi:hypothetical protein